MPQEPVGLVGLGVMGSAMSTHLLGAGLPVLGFDIDPRRCAGHARGGTVCDSAADVAPGADVVVTSLPSAAALMDALDGEGGMRRSGRAGWSSWRRAHSRPGRSRTGTTACRRGARRCATAR